MDKLVLKAHTQPVYFEVWPPSAGALVHVLDVVTTTTTTTSQALTGFAVLYCLITPDDKQKRVPFNPLSYLKNPMVIMMIVVGGMALVPKLMSTCARVGDAHTPTPTAGARMLTTLCVFGQARRHARRWRSSKRR